MKKILLAVVLLLISFRSFSESGEIYSKTASFSATADALTADPVDCSSNQYAHAIAANGDLTCSALSDADVPNGLTISGGTVDNSVIGGTTPAAGTFTNILVNNSSSTIVSLTNTDPDVFSGNLNQVSINAKGGTAIAGSADQYRGLRIDATVNSGTQSDVFRAIHAQVQSSGSASLTGIAGSGMRGGHFASIHDSTGTAAYIDGISTNAVGLSSGSSVAMGTITTAVGNRVNMGYSAGATGTGATTDSIGLYVLTPQNTSAGRTITNFYGLKVDDAIATGVTNAYSLHTGTGIVSLGGNVQFSNAVTPDATQFQIGRNSDSPSRLFFNIPTSRTFEFSVNDVEEYTMSSTDMNMNNNTLSNIGGSGTDFTNVGALVIGNDASATGTSTLTLNQGSHTAITNNQPALNVSSFTETVNSGSTIASASSVDISPATYNGVAGGGTETVTDAATLRIAGPAIQGTNVTVANSLSFLVDSGDARFDGFIQSATQTVTVADDGAGTPALVTITPTTNNIQITCNDVNGCNVTLSETGQRTGVSVRFVNMSANAVNFADTGGVSESAGAFNAGQYDSICYTYQTDRWIENSRSNN